MNFSINLTHFYVNFTRQEHQIDVLYVLINAWDSQVSSFTPFHFSFTVPLRTVSLFQRPSMQRWQCHIYNDTLKLNRYESVINVYNFGKLIIFSTVVSVQKLLVQENRLELFPLNIFKPRKIPFLPHYWLDKAVFKVPLWIEHCHF